PARWAVTQALAEGGIRRIFAQTSQVASPERLPLCLLRQWDAADVDVAALVRPVSGGPAEAGGRVWRGRDGENFYALLLDGRGGRLAAIRVERGRPAPLPIAGERGRYAVSFRVERERWYQLRARVTGTRFEFFVDGIKRFEVEDDAIRGAGA